MKFTKKSILLLLLLGIAPVSLWGEDGEQFTANLIETQQEDGYLTREDASKVLNEVHEIFRADHDLALQIELEKDRLGTTSRLMWAAAKISGFDNQTFRAKYPALAAYGNVLWLSKDYFGSPHLIYQTAIDRFSKDIHMVYGQNEFVSASNEVVKSWDDPEGLADFKDLIDEYAFQGTNKGPYLVGTKIGRETTGATTIRHIIFWLRIEATKLVPERFDAYDVPIGKERLPENLKATAHPTGMQVQASPPTPQAAETAKKPAPDNILHMVRPTGAEVSTILKDSQLATQSTESVSNSSIAWFAMAIAAVIGIVWLLLRKTKL